MYEENRTKKMPYIFSVYVHTLLSLILTYIINIITIKTMYTL